MEKYQVYSKPFQPIKEVLFCKFPKFFAQTPEQPEREGADADDLQHQVGQSVANGQKKGGEEQKVEASPQEEEQHRIAPHLPLVGGDAVQKQGGSAAKPEQEVQHSAQEFDGNAGAENPQQVIKQSHYQSQQAGAAQGHGLMGQVYFHISGTVWTAGRPVPGRRPRR